MRFYMHGHRFKYEYVSLKSLNEFTDREKWEKVSQKKLSLPKCIHINIKSNERIVVTYGTYIVYKNKTPKETHGIVSGQFCRATLNCHDNDLYSHMQFSIIQNIFSEPIHKMQPEISLF